MGKFRVIAYFHGDVYMKIMLFWVAQFVGINGGIEKVFTNFANEMIQRGHSVEMVYCTEKHGEFYTSINPKVNIINLADYLPEHKFESARPVSMKMVREFWRIVDRNHMASFVRSFEVKYICHSIKELLENINPEIIISFSAKSTQALQMADIHHHYPIISMVHSSINYLLNDYSPSEIQALANSDVVQVLVPEYIGQLQEILHKNNIVCIPNIVPQLNADNSERKGNTITEVARLAPEQKRQHLLIEAFSRIANQFPEWKVDFWGGRKWNFLYSVFKESYS